ncbi:glycerol-3-phosphate dehydrogenase [Oceanisphaera psychrotolerans]|uniref:Glycerol-3-phosphate dehydrogenase n=1 Tax=Oceanisphaera psychrotolerans TaxID=1414654 RepID=A0A1J4QGS9_9GAMM|nr:glycerol-3-phosphate dehydrogenase [Oceanisphaera psychrotolerans]OIN14026.1 glycerol-3-phosphate dehydrogenase [Oceanisphaera psychrotolerans]
MTSEQTIHDLLVVGGGVNGTGIAMDAAGRGLKVVLCEMNDLASATSSNSSKLIHGGLRYLEHYEFRLVKEALAERESLLRNAPHIMWPLRFRLPHRPHLRPAWMIRIGLFLYDHLAKRERLAGSNGLRFGENSSLVGEIKKGFEYSDGWVDDARLVVLCAMAARNHGADIRTRTRCIRAERQDGLWKVTLQHNDSGERQTLRVRALINAAGPWASKLFDETMSLKAPKKIRLVKGSHIIVPRLHDEPEAYILQNEDNRIVFVIPYEDNFSLIGTTDVDYQGNPSEAAISAEEVDYLCAVVNDHFKRKISADDVVWTYSGVRPLMDDERGEAQKASRDYTFEVDAPQGEAPLLSIFGGKITTYRKLAEAATNAICRFFPEASGPWTKEATLPGGNFEHHDSLNASLKRQFPWLPEAMCQRFVRTYGNLCHHFLDGCTRLEDLGPVLGATLHQKEVDYLIEHEWAVTLEDIIWRRTKLGLYLTEAEKSRLQQYLYGRQPQSQRLAG